MREAGQVVAQALAQAATLVEPGVRTREIDAVDRGDVPRSRRPAPFQGRAGQGSLSGRQLHLRQRRGRPRHSGRSRAASRRPGQHRYGMPPGRLVCRLGLDLSRRRRSTTRSAAFLTTGQSVLELAIAECGRKQRWSEVAAPMADEVRRAGFSRRRGLRGTRHRPRNARGSPGPQFRQPLARGRPISSSNRAWSWRSSRW